MPKEEEQINTLKIGSMLEEFEIISVLGQGGFGITYKVMDNNINKMMVIKEYMPSQFASRENKSLVSCISSNKDDFQWGMTRFIEEAKVLSEFEHPNIVKARRLFKANNTAYFVMDFYEGETLDSYLTSNKNHSFTQDEILSVMMPILEGLKNVHSQGFLHRDIAPDNIFLRLKKSPILIDFGASRHALGTKSQNISAIIKQGYSPPEQYTSKSKQNETTDLYAISAVMYQMITGDKPPESTHRQEQLLNDEKDPIEDIVSKYGNRFEISFLQTILKGLNIRRKDRIQTIKEYQEGLVGKIEKEKTIPTQNIYTPPKNNLLKIIISLLIILIAGLVWFGLDYNQKILEKQTKQQEEEKNRKIQNDLQKEQIKIAQENKDKLKKQQEKDEEKRKLEEQTKKLQEETDKLKKQQEALKKEREEIQRQKDKQAQIDKDREEKKRIREKAINKLNTIFSKYNVTSFINSVMSTESQNNVYSVLKYFDNSVSPYFSIRTASHDDIYKDKKAYFRRWHTRSYRLESIDIKNRYKEYGELYSDIIYQVYWEASNGEVSKSGMAKMSMTIKSVGDSFKITSINSISNKSYKTQSISKEKHANFSSNGIDIEFTYPSIVKSGEHFIIKVSMTNNTSSAKQGGLTLSFPDMINMSGSIEDNNFATLKSYRTGIKIYNQTYHKNKPAEYFMIEGWHNRRWTSGSRKYFSVKLKAPYDISRLRINVRGILWIRNSRDTIKIPYQSSNYDQQGFAVKKFYIQIKK